MSVPMPIIVGAPRSGTTLLRFMLDSHADLAIPPETGFLAAVSSLSGGSDRERREEFFRTVTDFPPGAPGWQDFGIDCQTFLARLEEIEPFSVGDGCRAFYRLYATKHDKPRWGDKTPTYSDHLCAIEAVLPESHFVHLIRDGRDVALSLREMWFSPGREIETLAAFWRQRVLTARLQGAQCRRYLEVRFEDLVEDPLRVLTEICAFIELPYSDAMLRYHERAPTRLAEHRDRRLLDGTLVVSHADRLAQQASTMRELQPSRAEAWKKHMDVDEQRRFVATAGEMLATLGYDV